MPPLTNMAIERLRELPRSLTPMRGRSRPYEATLSAVPSREWRAAFLSPPIRLKTARATPELGRVGLDGARVVFRTTPSRLQFWLRWIDRWVAYANSVVPE